MPTRSLQISQKKRRSRVEGDEDDEFAPDTKQSKLCEVAEVDDMDTHSEPELPKRSIKWWNTFYDTHSKWHDEALASPSREAFLNKILPTVDAKWSDKVMYKFVYSGRGELRWKHYELVTKEQDVAIKAYIADHPDFELYLGRAIAGDAEETMTWRESFKSETSDPRTIQDINLTRPASISIFEYLFKAIKRKQDGRNEEEDSDDEN